MVMEQVSQEAYHDAIPLGLFDLFPIEPKVIWSLVQRQRNYGQLKMCVQFRIWYLGGKGSLGWDPAHRDRCTRVGALCPK
jgi:hypothetical protein